MRNTCAPGSSFSPASRCWPRPSCWPKLFSENYPGAAAVATIAFVVLWLALTGFNMWVGVAKAGYSAAEEFPILLLLFGVPAIVAIVLKWKFI